MWILRTCRLMLEYQVLLYFTWIFMHRFFNYLVHSFSYVYLSIQVFHLLVQNSYSFHVTHMMQQLFLRVSKVLWVLAVVCSFLYLFFCLYVVSDLDDLTSFSFVKEMGVESQNVLKRHVLVWSQSRDIFSISANHVMLSYFREVLLWPSVFKMALFFIYHQLSQMSLAFPKICLLGSHS